MIDSDIYSIDAQNLTADHMQTILENIEGKLRGRKVYLIQSNLKMRELNRACGMAWSAVKCFKPLRKYCFTVDNSKAVEKLRDMERRFQELKKENGLSAELVKKVEKLFETVNTELSDRGIREFFEEKWDSGLIMRMDGDDFCFYGRADENQLRDVFQFIEDYAPPNGENRIEFIDKTSGLTVIMSYCKQGENDEIKYDFQDGSEEDEGLHQEVVSYGLNEASKRLRGIFSDQEPFVAIFKGGVLLKQVVEANEGLEEMEMSEPQGESSVVRGKEN